MKNRLDVGNAKSKPVPVKIVNDECTTASPKVDRKWEAQDALRTLQRADEVRRDKGLMKEVKNIAKEQIKALSKVK